MYWSTQDDTEQVRKHLIILDGADKQIKRILFAEMVIFCSTF